MTQTNAQSDVSRWPVAAAIFAFVCNLLCVALVNYQNYLINDALVLNYPEIFSECFLLTPLLVAIIFRRVAAITFTYALMLSVVLAGRIYYSVQFHRVGTSAFVPKMDLPGLGLILLAGVSLLILLVFGLSFATSLINSALKRGNGVGTGVEESTSFVEIVMAQASKNQPFGLARMVVACFLLFLLPAYAATPIPFSVPVRFGSDKLVEFPVELTRHRYYQIDVVFPFKNAEQRVDARKLAGEPTQICAALSKCGVTPSFLVTVRRGADVLSREESTPVGIYAFSSNGFYRHILEMRLKPAHYDITVEVTHSPNELEGYDALIQFTTDSRAADLEN